MLRVPRRSPRERRAVAAVEFALVAPVLVIILVGLWEVGRLIHLQQLLSSAAREGARVAAQGLTINSEGDPTEIKVFTGNPNVHSTVVNTLRQSGLNVTESDVTVSFTYTTGDTTKTEPYQAVKGQQYRITVTVPLAKLRWVNFAWFTPSELTTSVNWTSLVDDPFQLDPTLPSW